MLRELQKELASMGINCVFIDACSFWFTNTPDRIIVGIGQLIPEPNHFYHISHQFSTLIVSEVEIIRTRIVGQFNIEDPGFMDKLTVFLKQKIDDMKQQCYA